MHVAPRIVLDCFQLLSIVVYCCPLLSMVVHCCPLLSIVIIHCGYHRLGGTFEYCFVCYAQKLYVDGWVWV